MRIPQSNDCNLRSSLHPSVVESLGAVEDVPTESIITAYKLCCYMGSAQQAVGFMFAGIELVR